MALSYLPPLLLRLKSETVILCRGFFRARGGEGLLSSLRAPTFCLYLQTSSFPPSPPPCLPDSVPPLGIELLIAFSTWKSLTSSSFDRALRSCGTGCCRERITIGVGEGGGWRVHRRPQSLPGPVGACDRTTSFISRSQAESKGQ